MKWKFIKDYEDCVISDNGHVQRVVSSPKRKVGYLNIKTDKKGYKTVSLSNVDGGKNLYVHRLVASAFIDNPLNKPCVNHIDLNRGNNNVSNLEWVTSKENNHHALLNGCRNNVTKLIPDNKVIEEKKRGRKSRFGTETAVIGVRVPKNLQEHYTKLFNEYVLNSENNLNS